ncbi:site-specific integrase [Hyphomonas sp. GM-8P]|uniref:tyrosine-type recombinase/integrase n=1 Tax=Hyphomonas sp. GM-8P TaxID=1280945 RepID=UPI000DD3B903|nr:site-specific integrase [Hyphomonas sp. GM-8P]
MAKRVGEHRITKRLVDSAIAEHGNRTRIWDSEQKGFCLVVYPTGRKVYVVGYGFGGRYRWYTIGKHGDPWTPETARDKAKEILGEVAKGNDPSAQKTLERVEQKIGALTISKLIDLYLDQGPIDKPDKRESSWVNDKNYLNNHARRLLGRITLGDLKPHHISRFQNDVLTGVSAEMAKGSGSRVRGGRGAASHAVRSLSAMLGWAVKRELVESNPCLKINKIQDGARDRYLTTKEAERMFKAIDALLEEGEITQDQVDCLELIFLTAARASEIKALQWKEVDLERRILKLPPLRHKTGGVKKYKSLPLSARCVEILTRLSEEADEEAEYVFPSSRSGSDHIKRINHTWEKIAARAKIKDFRIHDFRHAYASFAINAGESLKMIGANLGHQRTSTTERYAHLLVDSQRPVADGVEAAYEYARKRA